MTPLYYRANDKYTGQQNSCLSCREVKSDVKEDKEVGKKKTSMSKNEADPPLRLNLLLNLKQTLAM